MNPLNLIAAPLAAATFTLPPVAYIDPAELWAAGVDLTAAELSSLLEDCTGYRVDADTDADGLPAFYLVDPYGDRDPDPWKISPTCRPRRVADDEALADCAPDSGSLPPPPPLSVAPCLSSPSAMCPVAPLSTAAPPPAVAPCGPP